MTSLEAMDARIAELARNARRTTSIDTIVHLRHLLRETKIDPRALSINEKDVPAADRILLHAADLLDMAVYAWYELQKQDHANKPEPPKQPEEKATAEGYKEPGEPETIMGKFHKAWSAAVGTPRYVKEPWKQTCTELERGEITLNDALTRCSIYGGDYTV